MKAKFITIEGCEGVGKSTQVRLLKEYFASHNLPSVFTREPGGTSIAERIREIILYDKSDTMSSKTELLLYAASRAQHVDELILPALNDGKTVICDRFSDSTLAYQGYGRGMDIDMIKTLNAIATGGLEPDLTLFLDLSPEAAFARKGGAEEGDRLEAMGFDFHKRIYEGFCSIDSPRFLKIDASGSKFQTHDLILNALRSKGII